MTKRSFNEKFWEDKRGNVVVWQRPNIWLITWFVTMVAGWIVNYKWLGWISLIALIVWAVLELFSGVNYFRRSLGLLVLLLLATSRLIVL